MRKRINPGYIIPSAAYTIPRDRIVYREPSDTPPSVGDVIYGSVRSCGFHHALESRQGRIHAIHTGRRGIFVFGNRYAPDAFEGIVPDTFDGEVDLLARSGVVGRCTTINSNSLNCTRIKTLGYVCDREGNRLNTLQHPFVPLRHVPSEKPGRKMILFVGTAMNSGKSTAAAVCCRALSACGYRVTASKITGTASLKDLLLMEDCGAGAVSDFTHLGYPSTYRLDMDSLLSIAWSLEKAHAQGKGFWIVEIADGILQRETAMLLSHPWLKSRIHRLVFCARDALGVIGGLQVLRDAYGLQPDAISGVCASAPLALREMAAYCDLPHIDALRLRPREMAGILTAPRPSPSGSVPPLPTGTA